MQSDTNILQINNLSKYFGGLAAVADCSLRIKKGLSKIDAQKYVTSLFFAMSEDAVVNSKKDLRILIKNSQTPGGLNEQALKKLRRSGYYKLLNNAANDVLKRLKKNKK